jgi:nucleolar pre-ribosomal-associated protein 2
VDLTLCESHPETRRNAKIQLSATPKAEWTLRWLLKRLKNGKNYRVDPASFLLLRQLIDVIPPKNLATTLREHKFLSILCDTVADLEADIFATVGSGQSIATFDSDSSHTLAGSPTQHDQKSSKGTKRKRVAPENGGEVVDEDDQPQNPASCFLAFIRALDCLYGVVTLAQQTLGTDENANSHLKLSLRGEPALVARFLGRSFQVAAVAITQFSQVGKTTDLQHLIFVLPAVLEPWESRSFREDDTHNKASNEAFAKFCFAHGLRLQLCLRDTKLDTDERAHLLHAIERILALHVLLPARAAFFERGGSGIDYSQEEPDWSPVEPVTDTFRPIVREYSVIQMSQGESKDVSSFHPSWQSIELLPELFDNAVRAVPRDIFRRQTHEAPWLETLFVAVAELAYTTAKEEDPDTLSTRFVSVLEELLRVALSRNVGLSLHTVLTHAGYTGLLKEGLDHVQWNVTALVISLGVDIFLPNSGLPDSRKLLDALLDKIMLQWHKGFHKKSCKYDVIKNDVVIPLLRGFAAARDLTTFMELWHHQLVKLEDARMRNDSLPKFSVWEDDDLCDAYSEVMRTSLTGTSLAEQMRSAATKVKADNGRVSESSESYAEFVLMEAGFRGRTLTSDYSEDTLVSLIETLSATLSSKQTLHWRWRLWRFVRVLLENNTLSTDGKLAQATSPLLGSVAGMIRRNHKNLDTTPLAPLEAWEAYRYALVVVKGKPTGEQLGEFADISKRVTDFIVSVSTDSAKKSMKTPWNGRIETLDSPITLCLAYFLALVRVPEAWERVPSEKRSLQLEHLLSLAAVQYRSSSLPLEAVADNARFLQAWTSVMCHEYLLSVPFIVQDLVQVLNQTIENDHHNRRLCVESMQRIPAALITRGLRTAILNKFLGVLLQQDSSPELTVGLLTMMAKLAAMPKCDAIVTAEWEPISTAARAINLQGTEVDLQIMKSFRSLHRAVIAKLLVLKEDDRIEMLKKLFARTSKQASKLRQIDRDSMADFLLRLTLAELWAHRKQLRDAFDEDELAACRQRVFGLILADMKSVKEQCRKQKLEETITLIKTIDALEDFEDLVTNNIEVEKFLSKIEHYMEMSIDSAPSRLIRRRLLASKGPEKSITKPVLQCAETLTLQSLYAEDQQLFMRATTERFRSMTPEKIGQAIREIRELGFSGDSAGYRLLVIYLALVSLPPIEDKESSAGQELSLLGLDLSTALPKSTSITQFCLTAECLSLLLRVHTRSLGQCNVDGVLMSIGSCASKVGPRISPEYAPTIYTRLCRLMGLVLGLQRLKIGGRFHLVVNAMQRLLTCLFAKSRKRSRSAKSQTNRSQPFWLAPLSASHTTHYTRLLTSLCDPTVSAVLRPQPGASREALTDETKKAKRIAGQYLQYVVTAYTRVSLNASLQPDVKAALMPGLYAALDVMSRESMRALNAALDVSGRAVFKSLYDDYVKFGKWNKA